jgi:mono/diheme cytochrome c family protein
MVQQRVPILSFVLIIALMVTLIAPASAQKSTPPPAASRPVDGAGIFRTHCATCHGAEAHGDGPAAKALKREVPDLTRLSERSNGKFPAVHVRNTILLGDDDLLRAHGSKGMPIWGPIFHEIDFDQDLGNVRLENIVKYLESIQRK